jgi:hypothetical protein
VTSGIEQLLSITSPAGDAVHLSFRGRSAAGAVSEDVVTYRGALEGVDVKLKVTEYGAKEDVILRNANSDRNLSYLLQTGSPDLALAVQASGSLTVRRGSRDVFTIPAPVMFDGRGSVSVGSTYRVERVSAQAWEIVPVLDHAWLDSSDRTWPGHGGSVGGDPHARGAVVMPAL